MFKAQVKKSFLGKARKFQVGIGDSSGFYGSRRTKTVLFSIKWAFQTGENIRIKCPPVFFCLSFVENRRKIGAVISDIVVIYQDLLLSDVNPVVGSSPGGFCSLFFPLDVEFWGGKETSSPEYLLFLKKNASEKKIITFSFSLHLTLKVMNGFMGLVLA